MRSNPPDSVVSFASHRELEDGDDNCNGGLAEISDYDRRLHKVSIIVLFFASVVGVALSLGPKYSNRLGNYPYLIVLGKCAGTGVMLSCSLVHMLLPSTEALTNPCLPTVFSTDYPAFSYAFAVLAALFSHLTEFLMFNILSGDHAVETDVPAIDRSNDDNCIDRDNLDDCSSDPPAKREVHECNAETLVQNQRTKQLTEAVLTELSLSVHSVFVGLSLGVSEGSTLVALLIAIVFHQLLEGVALGCRLSDSHLGHWTVLLFGFIFSISGPVGILIGISVYSTMNPNSQSFLLIQGIFEGICGGLLLYMGFQLLLVDFHRDLEKHCKGKGRNLKIVGMFLAVWISAFAMSLIGRWA